MPSHKKKTAIDASAFIHPSAVVVGDVSMGKQASAWPGASIRGDLEPIVIGDYSNVQDNCVIHTMVGGEPTLVGQYVSLGHASVVHSATIEDECLIGMNATVLDGAVIGRGSLVAAGAVVSPGTNVPENSLVMGVPGRVVKQDPTLRQRCRENAERYLEYVTWHRRGDFPVYRA